MGLFNVCLHESQNTFMGCVMRKLILKLRFVTNVIFQFAKYLEIDSSRVLEINPK